MRSSEEEEGLLSSSSNGNHTVQKSYDLRVWARRVLVVTTLAIVLGVAIGAIIQQNTNTSSLSVENKVEESSPHIVFFFVDDMGYADIGYNSYDLPKATPFMDSLASEGVVLTSYYTQFECTPARAALLTGRYPISTGMQHECVQVNSPWGLHPEETLLPQYLARFGGYSTHMVGKWDLGHFAPSLWPTKRGFETWVGLTCYGYNDYFKHTQDSLVTVPGGTNVIDLHHDLANVASNDVWAHATAQTQRAENRTYSTALFGEAARRVVEEHNTNKPLFLYVAWNAVHNDLSVPEAFLASDIYSDITAGITDAQRLLLAGAVYIVDEHTKKVVDALKNKGMYERSIIVVTSDNGGNPSTGGNNFPLKGTKKSLFEGGLRVPAFVHSPLLNQNVRGTTYDDLFHVTDWLPTLVLGASKLCAPSGSSGGSDDDIRERCGDANLKALDGKNQWEWVAHTKRPQTSAPLRTEAVLNIDFINSTTAEEYTVPGSTKITSSAEHSWSGILATLNPLTGESDATSGLRFKLLLEQDDGRTYEPFTGDARGKEQKGYFAFLYDLSSDENEMNNLLASQQDGSTYDLEKIIFALATRLCDAWTNRMVSTKYRQQDWIEPIKAFSLNDNFVTYWKDDSKTNYLSEYPVTSAPACDATTITDFVLTKAPTPAKDEQYGQ